MIYFLKEVDIQKSLRDNHNIYVLPMLSIYGWYYDIKYKHKETSELISAYTQYKESMRNSQYYETYEEALSFGNKFALSLLNDKNEKKKKSQYDLLLELADELSSEHKNKDKILVCLKNCGILDDNSEFTEEFKNLKNYEITNK